MFRIKLILLSSQFTFPQILQQSDKWVPSNAVRSGKYILCLKNTYTRWNQNINFIKITQLDFLASWSQNASDDFFFHTILFTCFDQWDRACFQKLECDSMCSVWPTYWAYLILLWHVQGDIGHPCTIYRFTSFMGCLLMVNGEWMKVSDQ
jgi:hypothetical protein